MFNFASLKPLVTNGLGRTGLVLQKHSPTILTTVGVVGVVTAGVMASRATLKLQPVLDNKDLRLTQAVARREDEDEPDYGDQAYAKDVTHTYMALSLDLVKVYGPAITLGAASIAAIIGAHGIMRRRNVALAAAYKTVESAFGEYRKRVQEELGDDKELEIRRNIHEQEVTDENDKKSMAKIPSIGTSPYAKFFDELSPQWQKDANYNLTFLRVQEDNFTQILNSRGHVFLNEVYDALGIPMTPEGQLVGWLKEGKDGYVDFGIYDFYNEQKRMFVNGVERSILLDFNVDGVIYDKI